MVYSNKGLQNRNLVQNSAGGLVYPVDKWLRLRRFLILGSAAGNYYTTPEQLTLENVAVISDCLKEDGLRVVNTIVEISKNNLAIKNSPAIFALAIAASPFYADNFTNRNAVNAISLVCRTSTHLFEFIKYVDELKLRGWGRSFKRAVAEWYLSKSVRDVTYQVTKYQSRYGWSHGDLLRLSHPKPLTQDYSNLFNYVINGIEDHDNELIGAVERAKIADNENTIIALIREHHLTHEMIPSRWHASARVWEELLVNMPLTAMLRSLARSATIGALNMNSYGANTVLSKLTPENVSRSRVHPFQILLASHIYGKGYSRTTRKSWSVNRHITDRLNELFYQSFGNVVPSNQRILVAIDRSGSMNSSIVEGSAMEDMHAAHAAAAMALVFANTEPNCEFVRFNSICDEFTPFNKHWSIHDLIRNLQINNGTDCSTPIQWAMGNHRVYDAIVILTDSESWQHKTNPYDVYTTYRRQFNPNCKLITVAMTSNGYTLNNPEDASTMDCIGFDLGTPQAVSEFLKGNI